MPEAPKKGSLFRAIVRDNFAEVINLTDAGADINENIGSPTDEITPLLAAVAFGNERITNLLIERGAAAHSAFQKYTAKDFAFESFADKDKMRRVLSHYEATKITKP